MLMPTNPGALLDPGYLGAMRRLLAAIALLGLSACGQVEPVMVAITMPDCVHRGATSMSEGRMSLSLTLNGIADAAVILVEIPEGRSYSELEESLDDRRPPSWATEITEVRLSSAQGVEGAVEEIALRAGDYAVVCVDDPDGEALRTGAYPLRVSDG